MDAKCYIELRRPAARGTDSAIADTMRHLNTRQHLGKAVIICDQPTVALSVARKQWLKLSRSLQKRRSSTLNADKIIKYTHAITRMQRMYFTIKTPLERPAGEVFFLLPQSAPIVPANCWTVYLLCPIDPKAALDMITQLPKGALIVDYTSSDWGDLGLEPKKILESRVTEKWRESCSYLRRHKINVNKLASGGVIDTGVMDDALDTLLGGHSHEFLEIANSFQRALELARPLRLKKETRYSYDSLILLAYRVQALRPGAYSQHFLESYNEDDTFFLYDIAHTRKQLMGAETPEEAYTRHKAAGRHNLAKHLRSLTENSGQ